MTMKRTELEKRQGLAIVNEQRRAGNAFERAGQPIEDRKARRERERAAGLVPFAIKLPKDLVAALHAQARAEGRDVDSVAADLLRSALQASPATDPGASR